MRSTLQTWSDAESAAAMLPLLVVGEQEKPRTQSGGQELMWE